MVQDTDEKSDKRKPDNRVYHLQQGNTYRIIEILSALVDKAWHFAEPFIQDAINHGLGEANIDVILTRLRNRNMQLWLVGRDKDIVGAFVTQIEIHPNLTILQIVHAGGKYLDEWVDIAFEAIYEMAQRNGCDYIQAHGRRGWHKHAKDAGFKETYRVYSRKVDG